MADSFIRAPYVRGYGGRRLRFEHRGAGGRAAGIEGEGEEAGEGGGEGRAAAPSKAPSWL